MNLADMKAIVRRDLHDEDSSNYRWTEDELERHIAHAVKEFSAHVPLEQKMAQATAAGSRELAINTITGRIMVAAVEYPVDKFPRRFQPFSLWGDTLTLIGDDIPDGSGAYIYYGALHTLDGDSSTIPGHLEDLVAAGACGYAALEWAMYSVNRVNVGGTITPGEFLDWGNEKLKYFRQELRRLGRRNRVRISSLYKPCYPIASEATDYVP